MGLQRNPIYLLNLNSIELTVMTISNEEGREPPPTLDDAIAELERELGVRKDVYPKWIKAGTIKRQMARKYYGAMLQALKYLQRLKEKSPS